MLEKGQSNQQCHFHHIVIELLNNTLACVDVSSNQTINDEKIKIYNSRQEYEQDYPPKRVHNKFPESNDFGYDADKVCNNDQISNNSNSNNNNSQISNQDQDFQFIANAMLQDTPNDQFYSSSRDYSYDLNENPSSTDFPNREDPFNYPFYECNDWS